MELKTETMYNITLTQQELALLFGGIGRTSATTRQEAGMTSEEAEFFSPLFEMIRRANKNL